MNDWNEWLPEQIRTCKNILATAEILLNVGRGDLLPTQLEILLEVVQDMVDENCVVRG